MGCGSYFLTFLEICKEIGGFCFYGYMDVLKDCVLKWRLYFATIPKHSLSKHSPAQVGLARDAIVLYRFSKAWLLEL